MRLVGLRNDLRKSIKEAAAHKISAMAKGIPMQSSGSVGNLTPKGPSSARQSLPQPKLNSPGIMTPSSKSGLDLMAPQNTPSQGLQSPGAAYVAGLNPQPQNSSVQQQALANPWY